MPSPLDHAQEFVSLVCREEPDGLGGVRRLWEEGAVFSALLSLERSGVETSGGRAAVQNRYTVLVDRALDVRAFDRFRRRSDGRMFRVLSDPGERCAPEASSLRVKAFAAVACDGGEAPS